MSEGLFGCPFYSTIFGLLHLSMSQRNDVVVLVLGESDGIIGRWWVSIIYFTFNLGYFMSIASYIFRLFWCYNNNNNKKYHIDVKF